MHTIAAYLELLRVRQWVKNGFVLAPLFFGARLLQWHQVLQAIEAFVVFCLVSSAVYIFNDWRDIEADRQHASKKLRPLPSGRIPVAAALAAMAVAAAAALAVLWVMQPRVLFVAVIAVYLAVNLGYSLGLKQVAVLELFLVSSGFVLRLLGGGYAIGVTLSPWIVVTTATLALSLTIGKRRGDIARANDGQGKRKSLAGYTLGYLDALLAALMGATLVVYLLFCSSDYAEATYGPKVLLTAVLVAGGLMRYLQLVMVYGDGEAPTDLLLRDKTLMAIVFVFVAMFALLIYLK